MPTTTLPPSYKALTYTHPSTPPHISYLPLPTPSTNQLLIKIHAAAINPVDIQLWANPLLGYLAGKKEKGIGLDYSGTVAAVGSGLKKWEVGTRVFGLVSRPAGEGTFAEYVLVDVGSDPVARIPEPWGWEEAASVSLVVLTAWACLEWMPQNHADEQQKRRVVVAGASGGVGMWCVQLAKQLSNCEITAICSGRNAEFVRGLGADTVIDYTTEDVTQTLLSSCSESKFDLYIDCVGGISLFPHLNSLLHKDAAYITIVGDKTSRTALGGPLTYFTYPSQVLRFVQGWLFGPRYANVMFVQKSEALEKVAALAEHGWVQAVVQEAVEGILDEERSAEAWERVRSLMEEGRVRGKVVVRIAKGWQMSTRD